MPVTVAGSVKQTLASLKGALATVETLASLENDAGSRAVLDRSAGLIAGVVNALEERTRALEFQEPQYKGL